MVVVRFQLPLPSCEFSSSKENELTGERKGSESLMFTVFRSPLPPSQV